MATRKQERRRLRDLEDALELQKQLDAMLAETDGWDDLPLGAAAAFIRGEEAELAAIAARAGGGRMLEAIGPDNFKRDDLGKFAPDEGGGGSGGLAGDLETDLRAAMAAGRQVSTLPYRDHPIYQVGNRKIAIKPRSDGEALSAEFAALAGVAAAPVARVNLENGPANAIEVIDGVKSISEIDPSDRKPTLALVRKDELERHALYDYVAGSGDPNIGNYLIRGLPNGRATIVAIDKTPAFAEKDAAGDGAGFAMPELLYYAGGEGFTFSASEVNKMAAAADRIATALESRGESRQAKGVRARADVLRRFSQQAKRTVAVLMSLGKGDLP